MNSLSLMQGDYDLVGIYEGTLNQWSLLFAYGDWKLFENGDECGTCCAVVAAQMAAESHGCRLGRAQPRLEQIQGPDPRGVAFHFVDTYDDGGDGFHFDYLMRCFWDLC